MIPQEDTQDTGNLTASQSDNAPKKPTRAQRRKRQRQRNETAREFLAWMPPLRHWPRNPEPFKPEDSEIFRWMLANPMIVEALEGLEGADRYRALAGMLNSARAKKVVRFNKEPDRQQGPHSTKHGLIPIASYRRESRRARKHQFPIVRYPDPRKYGRSHGPHTPCAPLAGKNLRESNPVLLLGHSAPR
jgi:hypothetical protein